jgi:CelD/BcsL family acetyltransferase involved in cellulose biosynthesis
VYTIRAPYIDVPDGGYEAWLASRSANFRQQMRRRRRDFVRQGGQFRQATSPAEMSTALDSFERLHLQRWQDRGGSRALTGPVVAMLRQAGGALRPERLQLWTAQVDGRTVGAALFVAAGRQVHYWLGGFDEQWARWTPSLLLLDQIVRYAAAEGHRRVSLGPGAGAYKYRFATGEDLLDWVDLVPRGWRYPYVRLRQSPHRVYRFAANHTPPAVKRRLKLLKGEP